MVTAAVEIRLIGGDLGQTISEMRTWLDRRKVMPVTFRQSTCPGGFTFHVEFFLNTDAENFAARFAGRILGAAPEYVARPFVGPLRQ